MGRSPTLWSLAAVCVLAAGMASQAQSVPLTTTLASIERYPTFFHGRVVTLTGTPTLIGDDWRLPRSGAGEFVVLPRVGSPPTRAVDLRGQLFDVGRLDAEDSRLSASGIRQVVSHLYGERWPARGALFVLVGASWTDHQADAATLRSIALAPSAFDGKPVTIRGRFRAQNLFGDLPAWPRKSQWDFVLQSADAAVWVVGLRPRGKGFDLDPLLRLGSRTWLEVAGTVRVIETLPTIEATRIVLTAPVEEAAPLPEPEVMEQQPPPSIVFSAPLDGDIDVDRNAPVRIQFSRDMKEASFAGSVLVSYPTAAGSNVPAYTVRYLAENHSIEIRFERPLAPGTDVHVDLSQGVQAADGLALAPVRISFRTKPSMQAGLSRRPTLEAARRWTSSPVR